MFQVPLHIDRGDLETCKYSNKFKNPVLFGASLHQLQDYFSHWREGYTVWPGHLPHTVLAYTRTSNRYDDFFLGGSYVKFKQGAYEGEIWVKSPYPAHEKESVISDILIRNPGLTRTDLVDNDRIIDLYLRKDTGIPGTIQTSNQRFKERGHFGIDPDLYVANSTRDITMRNITRYYIWLFFLGFKNYDPCDIWEADDFQIISLLIQ